MFSGSDGGGCNTLQYDQPYATTTTNLVIELIAPIVAGDIDIDDDNDDDEGIGQVHNLVDITKDEPFGQVTALHNGNWLVASLYPFTIFTL